MHNLILISLFLFSFICSKGETKNINDDPKKDKRSDSKPIESIQPEGLNDKQIIIPATEKMEWAFGRNYTPFTPTIEDICSAEDVLLQCYNKEVTGTVNPFFGRKLENYYRQFVGGETSGGEKIIYINCFCYVVEEYIKTWKTELIMVDDGGNCYFNVKVNLNKMEYYELMVNGLP